MNDMLFGVSRAYDYTVHLSRRKELISRIKELHPAAKTGLVVLFAAYEDHRIAFRQASSFYYYTGINEPGVVLTIDLDNESCLWVPDYKIDRTTWVSSKALNKENVSNMGIKTVRQLGNKAPGYELHPYTAVDAHATLFAEFERVVGQGGILFGIMPSNPQGYTTQRFAFERLCSHVPGLLDSIVDVSPEVAAMRRSKDQQEIECLYKAIDITCMGQESAAKSISSDMNEFEIQARTEYVFTASGTRTSFPSIVASGENSTRLHHHPTQYELKDGDLVVVDVGAEYGHYCGDITRTYPVSGTFTDRQKEIYNLVLEAQEYIASVVEPGYWLHNPDEPDRSLSHLASKFFSDRGYEKKYFPHGVSHFLGLDVHDVGDCSKPLAVGDVFTIEPGLYLPAENIGIRIEDNYWLSKAGLVCLSDQLPKTAEAIEAMVQQSFDDEESAATLTDEDDFDYAQG